MARFGRFAAGKRAGDAPVRNYIASSGAKLPRIGAPAVGKIAMAEGDLEEAKSQLDRVIPIVEKGYFPLAAWRVYLTAFAVYHLLADVDAANEYLHRAEKVNATLADNFDEHDPLRASLLNGFAAEIEKSQAAC